MKEQLTKAQKQKKKKKYDTHPLSLPTKNKKQETNKNPALTEVDLEPSA